MSDPIAEKLETIKDLIQDGTIQVKGIDKKANPLETDEVKFFLKVSEDILKIDNRFPYGNISIADQFMKRINEGNLKIRFNTSRSDYSPKSDSDFRSKDLVSIGPSNFHLSYVDLKTGEEIPFTTYRESINSLFQFVLDDDPSYKPTNQMVIDEAFSPYNQKNKSLAIKFTDKVMERYGEPPREIINALDVGHNESAKTFFEKNKEDLSKLNPEGYGDFSINDIEPKTTIPHESIIECYGNLKYQMASGTNTSGANTPEAYKEEFTKLWNLERNLYGDQEALISLTSMAYYTNLDSFDPCREDVVFTPEEIKQISEMAEKTEGMKVEKSSPKEIILKRSDGETFEF